MDTKQKNIIGNIKFGYIEAMLFCGVSDSTLSDDAHDTNYYDGDISELSEDLTKKILEKCTSFYQKNSALIIEALEETKGTPYDHVRLGNDLFFTAHGHGVGFRSRSELGEYGDKLTTVVEDGKALSPYALNEVFYDGKDIDGQ